MAGISGDRHINLRHWNRIGMIFRFVPDASKVLSQLERHTRKTESCWLWTGGQNGHGYGSIWINGKGYGVHRISAWLFLDLDLNDRGQLALHKDECPNKNCWNPDHLYVGTGSDNEADWIRVKGYPKQPMKLHCKRGHSLEGNSYPLSNGSRMCRSCALERSRQQKQRLKSIGRNDI